MSGMQVHDGTGGRPPLVHRKMQKGFLGRLATGYKIALRVDFGKGCRIEPSQAGVGRRHQPAVVHPGADVAGTSGREPAIEHGLAEYADLFPEFHFVHVYFLSKNPLSPQSRKGREGKSRTKSKNRKWRKNTGNFKTG